METTQSVAEYLLSKAAELRAGKLKAMSAGLALDASYCDAAAIVFEALAERARAQGWAATEPTGQQEPSK